MYGIMPSQTNNQPPKGPFTLVQRGLYALVWGGGTGDSGVWRVELRDQGFLENS